MTGPACPHVPDYRVDGLHAVSRHKEEEFSALTLSADSLTQLVCHHTPDGRHSYLLLHDASAIWDVPGTAEYLALHLSRDTAAGTFTLEQERHPVVPVAQNWLLKRGCPPKAIELTTPIGPRPADALTEKLETRLRDNPKDRYQVIDHYTHNPGSFDEGIEVYTLVHDHAPESANAPYRLFLEETSADMRSYTVREAAFTTTEAAEECMDARDFPRDQADPTRQAGTQNASTVLTVRPAGNQAIPAAQPQSARHGRRAG